LTVNEEDKYTETRTPRRRRRRRRRRRKFLNSNGYQGRRKPKPSREAPGGRSQESFAE
jgi:hypothetical protein